jgi:hypothetical protein
VMRLTFGRERVPQMRGASSDAFPLELPGGLERYPI